MLCVKACHVRGYNLFICISEHSAKEDIAAFESLVDHNVDGIIVATRSNKEGDERLNEIADRGVPVVVVGQRFSARIGRFDLGR